MRNKLKAVTHEKDGLAVSPNINKADNSNQQLLDEMKKLVNLDGECTIELVGQGTYSQVYKCGEYVISLSQDKALCNDDYINDLDFDYWSDSLLIEMLFLSL